MLTYQELARLPANELAKQDIAAMNLACAEGLPKTEWLKPQTCLHQLDYYARTVERHTAIEFAQFRKRPKEFNNSESFFRAMALVTILQRDLGIRVNPHKADVNAPFEPRDSFLFGITAFKAGTCGTLAILYVAVGRRLGYPIKLVSAFSERAGHMFCRWEGDETFNFDGAGHGMDSHPDSFYRTGRYLDSTMETDGQPLKSQTPSEELAGFLSQRAWHWKEVGNYWGAAEAIGLAVGLAPECKRYARTWNDFLVRWTVSHRKRRPQIFPRLFLQLRNRRFADAISLDDEYDFLGLEATEILLNHPEHKGRYWEPQRRREPRIEVPTEATVEHYGRHGTIHFTKFERFTGALN